MRPIIVKRKQFIPDAKRAHYDDLKDDLLAHVKGYEDFYKTLTSRVLLHDPIKQKPIELK